MGQMGHPVQAGLYRICQLLNPASHCDIAWAGGLASKANRRYADCGGAVA